MSVDGRSSGFGSEASQAVAVDFHHSVVWDLGAFSGSLLFLLDSGVEIVSQLVFERQLAAGSDCLIFGLLLQDSIVSS